MPEPNPLEGLPDPSADVDVGGKDALLSDYDHLGVGDLVDLLREKFPGVDITGQPLRQQREDSRAELFTTFVLMSTWFEGGRMSQQRGIRNLARRAYRVIDRYVRERGYVTAELNTYCEGLAQPPSAHFYLTAVTYEYAQRYSRRERSRKNWWVFEPVDHGPR